MIANIKFIKAITDYMDRERTIIGNHIYYKLSNGNKIKVWCDYNGVHMQIINSTTGSIDATYLPFENYFAPVQCHEGTQLWYQHIEIDRWFFEMQYPHLVPKSSDYIKLTEAMENYIRLFE